jgi:hypothetical protein
MSNLNYATMTDQELKHYFLAHRDEQEAFHAYMDRLNARPKTTLIAANELDGLTWDEQVKLATTRLQSHFPLQQQQNGGSDAS